MSVTVSFFPNSFRAQYRPFLTTFSKHPPDLETIYPYSLKEDNQLGIRWAILLIKRTVEKSVMSPFRAKAIHTTHTHQQEHGSHQICLRHSPWQTKDEGVSPGWTRAVMNTTFCSAPGRRFAAAERGVGEKREKLRSLNCAPDVETNHH